MSAQKASRERPLIRPYSKRHGRSFPAYGRNLPHLIWSGRSAPSAAQTRRRASPKERAERRRADSFRPCRSSSRKASSIYPLFRFSRPLRRADLRADPRAGFFSSEAAAPPRFSAPRQRKAPLVPHCRVSPAPTNGRKPPLFSKRFRSAKNRPFPILHKNILKFNL